MPIEDGQFYAMASFLHETLFRYKALSCVEKKNHMSTFSFNGIVPLFFYIVISNQLHVGSMSLKLY